MRLVLRLVNDKFNYVCSVLGLLVDVVVQQLHDQVHVSQDHASAAVSLATQLIEGLAENL